MQDDIVLCMYVVQRHVVCSFLWVEMPGWLAGVLFLMHHQWQSSQFWGCQRRQYRVIFKWRWRRCLSSLVYLDLSTRASRHWQQVDLGTMCLRSKCTNASKCSECLWNFVKIVLHWTILFSERYVTYVGKIGWVEVMTFWASQAFVGICVDTGPPRTCVLHVYPSARMWAHTFLKSELPTTWMNLMCVIELMNWQCELVLVLQNRTCWILWLSVSVCFS